MRGPPIQVQVAMTTIGMLRHGCHESNLGDVELAAEQAAFRAACDRLRKYLASDIQEPPPTPQPTAMLIVDDAHMTVSPRRVAAKKRKRKP